MQTDGSTPRKRPVLAWALLGPAALGAWVALRYIASDVPGPGGDAIFIRLTLGMPLAILGAAALTAPALYIGSAVMKADARPRHMLRQIAHGLDGAGLVMLGLMPAVLFLGATTTHPGIAAFVAGAALAGAIIFGVRLLFGRLYRSTESRVRALPVYAAWAVVTLGIGLMMTVRIVEGAV